VPLLCLLAALVLPCALEEEEEGKGHGEAKGVALLRPRYERVDGDIETVWQRPPGEPRGIFFIAHGCKHQATDLFTEIGPDGWRFEACPASNFGRCLGLPEEVRLRQAARARGYVVAAVSGGSGRQSCWHTAADLPRVAAALRRVRAAEGLPETAPVLALGASSGGAFVGRLAGPLAGGGLPHLRCIVPQIMSVGGYPNRGVPALFVHMARDRYTAEEVRADVRELEGAGVRVGEIAVEPMAVTAELLSRCLAESLAHDVATALREHGLVDDRGHLLGDSRARRWVRSVRRALAGRSDDTLAPDESCIAELMNVAWAQHEMTSEYAGEILDFCEEIGGYSRQGTSLAVTEASHEL